MATVTVHEAKTHLSRLIARALAGEEVVIARGREPTVRLVPIDRGLGMRSPGRLAGQFTISDAFYEPLSDEEMRNWDGA